MSRAFTRLPTAMTAPSTAITPRDGVPRTVHKRIVQDLDQARFTQ